MRFLILASAIGFFSAPASAAVALQSSPNPSTFGSPVTLTATVTPASATGRVTFYDGVAILGESQLAGGQATFTTRLLGAGTHTLHAYYAGSQSSNASQIVNSVAAGGFQPAVNSPAGTSPVLAIAADFNADGKTDLAIADYSGTVSALLGKGDGTFEAPIASATAPQPYAMVAGDFNGDGKPDLAVSAPGQVAILLGNGDGTFHNGPTLTAGTQPLSLAVIDANGDGNADLVVLNADTATVSVFGGNGDGTFLPPASYTAPSSKAVAQTMAAGDFNGDGTADLVIAGGGPLAILFGNGDGSFQTPVELPVTHGAQSVAVGDFNGDGKLDIVAGLSPTGVDVFLGNGDGTFQSPIYSEGTNLLFPSFGVPLVTGDFNGDSKLDIAVSDGGNYATDAADGVTVALGNGDGTFQQPLLYSAGSSATSALVAGDFNGDGRTDLAATTYASNSVGILLGQSAVNPTVTAVSVTPPTGSGASAIFSFQFSDTAGASEIASASGLVGTSVNPMVSSLCAVTYNRQQNTLALWNDNGTIPEGMQTGSGAQQNSSCSLDGRGSSVEFTGNTLTLNLAIAFNFADNGYKTTWGEAVSTTGATTGWRALGFWTVSVPAPPPQAVTVTPSTGAGPAGTFAFLYYDSLGASDLSSIQAIFQSSPGAPACALTVTPSSGSVGLRNDANTSLLGPLTLGATGTLQNSQCSVNVAASSGVASSNSYNLTLAVTFEGGFSGVKNLIAYAASNDGANSGYQTLGTWTVGAPGGPYLISTIAGGQGPAFGAQAASVDIGTPYMIALDGAGNVYFTEAMVSAAPIDDMHLVRLVGKVDTNGVLTKLADSSDFFAPYGIATDRAGNVYVSDMERIYKISPAGAIFPVAGTGAYGYSGDNGPALNATFGGAYGLAVDRSGNLYIADSNNGCIRKVNPGGIITTVAGTGTPGYSGDNGPATAAQLNEPYAVAVDAAGNIFVADTYNNRIRKISTGGVITTVAGTGAIGFNGDHIPATQANLGTPYAIAVDSAGNLYMGSNFDHRLRMVTPDGMISTIAGDGASGYGGDGGAAISAPLYGWSEGIAVDPAGNVYFSDADRIREVSKGIITTIAGGGTGDGGAAPFAGMVNTGFLATDSGGNVYFSAENRVRKVTPAGAISTLAGTGVTGNAGDGGPAVSAQLNNSNGIAFDASGNLFIADTGNNTVRKVSAAGTISTVAGNGSPGYSGDLGPATAAQLNTPTGVAVDASGNLFIADTYNQVVRKVDATGKIKTYAGVGSVGFSGDNGPATAAQLNYPQNVAVDPSGNLFIADSSNNLIRKVAVDGTITTYVSINAPSAMAVDAFGNLYAVDPDYGRVCLFTAAGCTSTLAGGGYSFYSEGGPALGTYLFLFGIAVDNSGKVYVGNHLWSGAIDMLTPENGPPVFTMSSPQSGDFAPGSTGQYTVTVNNASLAGPTRSKVTVTEVLSPWLTINSMSGAGWTCASNSCSRTDALAGGASYPAITITVNVSSTAPAQVTNQVTVSGGGGVMAGLQQVTQLDSLVINQTDSGPFLQGRTGTYTISAGSRISSGPTIGNVTITDTLPPGLTLVSMSGSSWTCPSGGTSCTSGEALLYGGASYPPLTVTVAVASGAPSPVMNLAGVSTPGFVGASAVDTTPVYPKCNVTQDANTSVSDVQRIINEALGVLPPADDLNSDGAVNVLDVQIAINAVLGLGCS
jgi:uncharacterized repeat protein (TIGR01451 family)